MIAIPKAKTFPLGQLAITPGALQAIRSTGRFAIDYIARHFRGDWGELDPADWEANDTALVDGTRLLSAYQLSSGVKIWVISESDRSSTCILLPEEY
ncbi:MAG: hypothetical protein L6455_07800 [Kiritimatiellae bacterium]|nr:hypothetical protein [Kiritimatiellia bacterium]